MASAHLTATVQQIYATLNDALATGNMALLDQVMAPNIVDHHPDPAQAPGLDAIKHAFAGLRDAFPDLHFSVDDVIADDDKVAVRLTCRATHTGAFLGFPATHRQVTYAVFDHLRLDAGKIVERWGVVDALGLLLQLGLTLPQA